jgi:hypothetical protein
VTQGSCDGEVKDWRKQNIIDLQSPQIIFASGYHGVLRCHRLAAPHILLLFARWEQRDLLHLLRVSDGAFNPRYKRGKSPSPAGHGTKRSDQVDAISNHAFGSAFDINEPDNPYGHVPAVCPRRGCVRELVETANELGFFWGGHFGSVTDRDGMHFEFAQF